VCHQTVGLISRAFEEAGIATTSVSSARDITAAARPARAAYVDFPHGHTVGRLGDPAVGEHIVRSALDLLHSATTETLVDLDLHWDSNDDWKDGVFAVREKSDGTAETTDNRVERWDTPQYELDTDADAAAARHEGEDCLVCIGIDF